MGVLNNKLVDFLCEHPIVPVFHHLPKVHQGDIPVKGHPIVAGIGSLIERLGKWVDQFLHPLVVRLLGYVKDTACILKHTKDIG